LERSNERVTPLCQYFGDCGGCQYQHLSYTAQLEVKHKQLIDLFQRVGGFTDLQIEPVIPCPSPYFYRNRVMIRSQWDKFRRALNIGFIRTDNRLVVDILDCKISLPEINKQITEVRKNPPPKGGLKVVLRVPPQNYDVPRDSFFQNNFILLPELVEAVRSALVASGNAFLIDAYCGVGFFGLELADSVQRFVGVEFDGQAIRAARENARRKDVQNGEFIQGRTEDHLPLLLKRFPAGETTLIIDPPRSGCEPHSLELLRQVRPSQIIYISCHPATLARDLKLLSEGGVFRVKRVVPVDMFPQTQHLECVADVRAA
jgi:tRNA/tmRNA/rRNA uracil-C5-methylase (TrmA/RlmC/RlmD family)